jgi:hypothetical protein
MATHKTKPQCHIHDKVEDQDVDDIRANVCVNDETLTNTLNGKYYCLFHWPTEDKDVVKFEQIFRARLDAVEKRITQIEKLSKEEQQETKRKLSYDFRYVWFPSDVELFDYRFAVAANFSWATFSATAYFSSATFSAPAYFSSATFSADAYFRSTTFSADAHFNSVTFSASVYFTSATFSAVASFGLAAFSAYARFEWTTFLADVDFWSATFAVRSNFIAATFSADAFFTSSTFSDTAHFNEATFSAVAYFGSATFSAAAYFNKTKFGKTGTTNFSEANFAKDTFFDRTRFRNDVIFNSVIFGEDSDVFFRRAFFAKNADFQYCTSEGYLRFSNLRQGKKSKFDFQEAAFEKASRISFHTVDLCPNWFVNVDSRKFVFTDVFWKHLDWDFWNKNINTELDSLADTGKAKQKKRIFEIAARQLAVNAEENNRYDEAAKFRYMAMETRRLEETKSFRASRFLIWLYKWTSGYGESWNRAALVLIGVLFFFGLFYNSPFANFELAEIRQENTQNLDFSIQQTETPTGEKPKFQKMNNLEGFVHSLYVAALQRPEPKAADTLTRLFVILETIFAPLQAALLALAIRRKFMR